MWQTLIEETRRDYALFDARVGAWVASYEGEGGRIHCRRGCSNCCVLAVNATLPEALCAVDCLTEGAVAALLPHVERVLSVAERASGLKEWLRGYREAAGFCPFLDEGGACSVYAGRPFSCRALLATRNSDWCAVDLSTLHPLEKQAFLSGLDRSAVAWPTHYAAAPQEEGFDCESRAARRMVETFGFSVSGNLPFLVWLEREFRISQVVPRGIEAVVSLLSDRGLNRPFLIALRDG